MTEEKSANIALRPKFTLYELLGKMGSMDDLDEIPDDAFAIAELTREKVDGYHDIIESLEYDAARLKARAEIFKDMAAKQTKRAARIKDRMAYSMMTHNCDRLPGNDFNAVRGKRRQLVVKQPVVTIEDFQRFPHMVAADLEWSREPDIEDGLKYPDLVQPTFTWNQEAIRAAYKDGTAPEGLAGLVDYDEKETFKFEPRKNV